MPLVIKLKRKRLITRKEIIVIVVAIILTTGAIKASDDFLSSTKGDSKTSGSPCPDDMAFVTTAGGGFCIDKYEASPAPVCRNEDPSDQSMTTENLDQTTCKPVSIVNKIPWRNISQDQAANACAKAGKRLPTGEEWLQASYGTPDIAARWSSDDCQVNSNWSDQPGLTGSGKYCVSAAGVYDMIGNVWEWTEGTADNGYAGDKKLPASGYVTGTDGNSFPETTDPGKGDANYGNDYFWLKENGVRAIARGGYWRNKSDAGKYSMYISIPPSQAEIGIGFRCVK